MPIPVPAELRHAARGLLRSPIYTTAAVLTLGLGIGANALVYSVADAVFLRPLPFARGHELVGISMTHRAANGEVLDFAVSPVDFQAIATRSRTLAGAGAINARSFAITGEHAPVMVEGGSVTASLWRVLGAAPVAGRTFDAAEDVPNATVLVVGESLQRRLLPGTAEQAIGRTLVVDGVARTVIGVMPRDFRPRLDPGELWVPLGLAPSAATGTRQLQVVARRKPGVSIEAARADMARIARELADEHPATNAEWGTSVKDLREKVGARSRPVALLLLASVALLLLLACANVANLSLVRVARRRAELSTRLALGASRGVLVRQHLLEAALVGLAAGVAGVLLAAAVLPPLLRLTTATSPMLAFATLDARVLAGVVVLSLLIAVLCAIPPILYGMRVATAAPLAGAGRRDQAGPRERRVRRALMGVQVSAAAVLLIGSFAVLTALVRLGATDVGFETESLMVGRVTLPASSYPTPAKRVAFVEAVVERLAASPGVRHASAVTTRFARGQSVQSMHVIEGREQDEPLPANVRRVAGDYFPALGVALLRGRAFTPADRDSAPPVAIVSESFVRQYLGTGDPIGRRMRRGSLPSMTIVGVVPDVLDEGAGEPVGPTVYQPYRQSAPAAVTFVIASGLAPDAAASAIRAAIEEVDRDQPVDGIASMSRLLSASLGQERFRAMILTALASLALVVAAIGIYGVTAYLVTDRTREIAIRLALGDTPRGLVRLLLVETTTWVGAGALLGLAISRLAAGVARSQVPELTGAGAGAYVATALLLLCIGAVATLVPALRAGRTAPAQAMRGD